MLYLNLTHYFKILNFCLVIFVNKSRKVAQLNVIIKPQLKKNNRFERKSNIQKNKLVIKTEINNIMSENKHIIHFLTL